VSELNGTNGKAFDYYPRLKRLREQVEQSYSEPISLEKAARIGALEGSYSYPYSYFYSYFRTKVGITFTEWLHQVRISKAIKLMTARGLSVKEIAYEVGFADLRTFERAFKKHTLKTPMEFKKTVAPE